MISCQQICVNACKKERSALEYDDYCEGGGPSPHYLEILGSTKRKKLERISEMEILR